MKLVGGGVKLNLMGIQSVRTLKTLEKISRPFGLKVGFVRERREEVSSSTPAAGG